MKKKRVIWTYGNVILPLDVGERARYFQNGVLKAPGECCVSWNKLRNILNLRRRNCVTVLPITMWKKQKWYWQHRFSGKGRNSGNKNMLEHEQKICYS